jgi:hypothetical protein
VVGVDVLTFEFDFQRRYLAPLAVIGVTPQTARVTVSEERLVARFGPMTCQSQMDNITDVTQTGPYLAVKAIGPRLALTDTGLTFGTSTTGGVCIRFKDPVPGIDPRGRMRHEELTVTVTDRDGLESVIRRFAQLA